MKTLLALLILISSFHASNVSATLSQDQRYKHSFGLQYNAFGIHVPTLYTTPFVFSFYINDYMEIGLQKGQTSPLATVALKNTREIAEINFDQVGVISRFYTGNSFNLFIGVENIAITGKNKYRDPISGITINQNFTANNMIGTLGIGNQWISVSGIIFGMDWFMLPFSLGNSVSMDPNPTYSSSPSAYEEQLLTSRSLEAAKTVNNNLSMPGVFKMYLGFVF